MNREDNSHRRPSGSLAVVSLALLLWAAPAASAEIEQTLRYAASYGNTSVGEIEVDIRAEHDGDGDGGDGGYVVTSRGNPSGLAAMFVKPRISVTRFVRQHGEVVLDRGSEGIAGGDEEERSFQLDRARARIAFSDGEHEAIQPGDRFVASAFPLLLMLRQIEDIAATRVREVSARRVRDYIYEQPVAETVQVPAGAFPSWKITRRRDGRPGDSVNRVAAAERARGHRGRRRPPAPQNRHHQTRQDQNPGIDRSMNTESGYRTAIVDWQEHEQAIRAIRRAVFVVEQGVCEELEFDSRDSRYTYALAFAADGSAIATGRLQGDGRMGRIGRMAVLKLWRGRGVGRAILKLLLETAAQRGLEVVSLHAQVRAKSFYAEQGFVECGEIFMEAGIEHITMTRFPPAPPSTPT